nr:hypothetical protein 7 [Candidatus Omnitrophota bacterium]
MEDYFNDGIYGTLYFVFDNKQRRKYFELSIRKSSTPEALSVVSKTIPATDCIVVLSEEGKDGLLVTDSLDTDDAQEYLNMYLDFIGLMVTSGYFRVCDKPKGVKFSIDLNGLSAADPYSSISNELKVLRTKV